MKFAITLLLILYLNIYSTLGSDLKPAKSVWKNTKPSDWGGGKTIYLDRHAPSCGEGSAISQFMLTRPTNNKLSYKYQCVWNEAITSFKTKYHTNLNDSNGPFSTNYLDRHDVNCPQGQVLSYFRLKTVGNKLQYDFECVRANILGCKSFVTPKSDSSRKFSSIYLDRQTVGVTSQTNNVVLKGFKLHSTYNPNKYFYSYHVCYLRDMEAQKKADIAYKKYMKDKENLEKATVQVQTMKGKTLLVQQKLLSLKATYAKNKSDYDAKSKLYSTKLNEKKALTEKLNTAQKENLKIVEEVKSLEKKLKFNIHEKEIVEKSIKNHEKANAKIAGELHAATDLLNKAKSNKQKQDEVLKLSKKKLEIAEAGYQTAENNRKKLVGEKVKEEEKLLKNKQEEQKSDKAYSEANHDLSKKVHREKQLAAQVAREEAAPGLQKCKKTKNLKRV